MPDTPTIAQGYPQNIVQRPDDLGWDYDLTVYVPGDFETTLSSFPAIGDTELIWGKVDTAVVLTRRFRVHQDSDTLATYCDMHCGTATDYWIPSVEDGALQKQLEFHPSYLMKWNYHLAMKTGTTTHSAFSTATTPALSEADAAVKKWVREPSEAPIDSNDGPWKIGSGFTKTKPGVDSYIYPSGVVREMKRFTSQGAAFAAKQDYVVGTVYESAASVSLTGTCIVMASNMIYDGAYWIVSVTYQFASSWDSDLYGAAQQQP